jgi:hypothetical protein
VNCGLFWRKNLQNLHKNRRILHKEVRFLYKVLYPELQTGCASLQDLYGSCCGGVMRRYDTRLSKTNNWPR